MYQKKTLIFSAKDFPDLRINLVLRIPLFLSLSMWERYGYNLRNIRDTIAIFSSIHLWQCALQFGITPSSSSVKITLSTTKSMVFGSKSIVIHKIMQYLGTHHRQIARTPSVLFVPSHHQPDLPTVAVSGTVFNKLIYSLPLREVLILSENTIPHLFTHKDILFYPSELHTNKIILCNRVVTRSEFTQVGRHTENSICTCPVIVTCNMVQYAVIEESFFAVNNYSQSSKSRPVSVVGSSSPDATRDSSKVGTLK
jgi:hypothetical protein